EKYREDDGTGRTAQDDRGARGQQGLGERGHRNVEQYGTQRARVRQTDARSSGRHEDGLGEREIDEGDREPTHERRGRDDEQLRRQDPSAVGVRYQSESERPASVLGG